MRRRVWKQLCILDWATAELAGTSSMVQYIPDFWVRPDPRNLNDSDIHPNMTEIPPDRVEATDMIFCKLRFEFGTFFNIMNMSEVKHKATEVTMEQKMAAIDDLEKKIEQKYLRYVDPINPLHVLVTVVSRSALCSMRLRLYSTSRTENGPGRLSPEEHNKLFQLSMRAMQYDDLVMSTGSLRRFHWHCRDFFQFHPVIFLLVAIRAKRVGEDVEQAWRFVEAAYTNRPELLERRKGLYVAVGLMAIQAWDARETELKRLGQPVTIPLFITKLRRMDGPREARHAPSVAPNTTSGAQIVPQQQQVTAEASTPYSAPTSSFTWQDRLFADSSSFGWEPDMNLSQLEQWMFNPEIQNFTGNEFGFHSLNGYFMPMQN
jgi:hypothetical protein